MPPKTKFSVSLSNATVLTTTKARSLEKFLAKVFATYYAKKLKNIKSRVPTTTKTTIECASKICPRLLIFTSVGR